MIKPPRLPNPGCSLEARYTKIQMRSHALKAMALEREECAKLVDLVYKQYEARAKATDKVTPEQLMLAKLICENLAARIQGRGK